MGATGTWMDTRVGRIASVHCSRDVSLESLGTYDIILGDINREGAKALQVLHGTHAGVCMPSYLPSKDMDKPRWPPAFDHIFAKVSTGFLSRAETQVFRLPKVGRFPRNVLKDWCSDHVPFEAVLVPKGPGTPPVRMATWNVADPWYVAEWYPMATVGFCKEEEPQRLQKCREVLVQLLKRNDVVALQEVPRPLMALLLQHGDLDATAWNVSWIPDPCDSEGGEDDGRCCVVLLCVRHVLCHEHGAPCRALFG